MGVLDDAIRQHLELRRKHGATNDELTRKEAEALGPARREMTAASDEQVAAGQGLEGGGLAQSGLGAPALADPTLVEGTGVEPDLTTPPAADPSVEYPSLDEASQDEPALEDDLLEHPPAGESVEPLLDPMPDAYAGHEPPSDSLAQEPPIAEPPLAGPPAAEPPAEPPAADRDHTEYAEPALGYGPEPTAEDELVRDEEVLIEDDVAADESLGDEYETTTLEHDVAEDDELAPPAVPPTFMPPGEGDAADTAYVEEYGEDEDDVLEETPEFLQETPEHDRLWFEQKPPRDFDFDDDE